MSVFEPPLNKDILATGNAKAISKSWWMWFVSVWNDIVLNNAFRLRSTIRINHTSSPYTMVPTIKNLVCDTDGGNIIVNIEQVAQNVEHRYVNSGSSGNTVTLNALAGEKIHGLSSQTLYDGEILNTVGDLTEYWW